MLTWRLQLGWVFDEVRYDVSADFFFFVVFITGEDNRRVKSRRDGV